MAQKKTCIILLAVKRLAPAGVGSTQLNDFSVDCMGEKCAMWSRLLEGCGLRTAK